MKYSQDLKDLAVKKVVDGQSVLAVSKELRIPCQSINNWHKRFLAEGHCKNKKRPGAKPRVTEEALIEFFDKNPNATLSEAGAYFGMTRHGISYWIKKFRFSLKKKIFRFDAADPKKQEKFVKAVQQIPPEKRVYIDESGIQKHLTRNRSWTKRGTVRIEKIPAGHQHIRVNVVGAIRGGQMITLNSFSGNCNSKLFNKWLDEELCPKLSADDTLIMDNARFHKKDEIKAIAERHNCRILFLPPYSPELNPIEHYWAHLKAWLRKFNGSILPVLAQIGCYFGIKIQHA
jgi:transposase